MSETTTGRSPADRRASTRIVLRVLGGLALAVAGILLVIGGIDFFGAVTSDDFDRRPTKFWLFFIALPLLAVGGGLLNLGFLGAVSRFHAEETASATRTTAEALGLRAEPDGPFCRQCGTRAAAADRFCSSCGQAIG